MKQKYILLLSALIATILSGIITVVPIGSYNQAQVSAMLPTLFTPATITFSIWSLIYLSWIALGLHEAFWKSWVSKQNIYLLASAQIISSLWLIPSQYFFISISLIVMLIVFILLSISLIRSQKESKYYRYTLELFFGWILVAFIANIHLTLVAYNLYFIPEILTYISILWALIINIFLIRKSLYIPALVCIWAAIGIIIAQDNTITQIISWASIFILILVWGLKLFKQRK